MKKVTLLDVKQALKDERFRKSLPDHLLPEVQKFLQNPSCPCNLPIYKLVLAECQQQLVQYFPSRVPSDPAEEALRLSQNQWTVVNCKVEALESELRKLPPGGKQVALARWTDEATLVTNEVSIDAEIVQGTPEAKRGRWKVIDCHVGELEGHLRKLGPGRKIISLGRYDDQVTAIINELDAVFGV
jgi:hypothetical protein